MLREYTDKIEASVEEFFSVKGMSMSEVSRTITNLKPNTFATEESDTILLKKISAKHNVNFETVSRIIIGQR